MRDKSKKRMYQNQNRTIIKILGSINAVKVTAIKIESLFPLYVEGPIKINDSGDGYHMFITLPGEPRQESPRTATVTPPNISLTELVSK
jgi:hypothetical protein